MPTIPLPPPRLCIGCGVTDTGPRHVIYGSQPWHPDCHVIATDCGSCKRKLMLADTTEGPDGVKGAELRARFIDLGDLTLADLED